MPITTEVTNTTFANLQGPLVDAFIRQNPLFRTLEKKAKVVLEGGHLIERPFAGGAPARGVGVFRGDERLNMTRRQQLRRYQVEPHRLVCAINIPKKELNYNSGSYAVVKLIEAYPKTTMEGAYQDINSYMLTGVSTGITFQSAELYGLTTLNGQFTAGRGTGITNGLLDFVATTSQNESVQNVTKASTIYHYNQYRDIGSWTAEGMRILRRVYRECAHYAGKLGGGPDVIIMDDATFANYDETRLGLVRLQMVSDKMEKGPSLSFDFGGAIVYSDLGLDLAQFTGVAADGVTYMVNTDHAELAFNQEPTISDFKERVGDQDVVTATWETQLNFLLTKFPAHGCVSGGSA